MKKNVFAKIALIAVAGFAVNAFADTSNANFNVKMKILKSCSVSSTAPTDLDFGSQLTTATNVVETTPGTISVTCSKNTSYTIGLLPSPSNGGTTAGAGNMKSSGAPADSVPYTLYSNAGRTALWGNIASNWVAGTRATGDAATKVYSVYGKVPSADFTPANDYIDVVAVTLTY